MTKWEYLNIGIDSETGRFAYVLNAHGDEGWELVALVKVPGSPIWDAFFKRPKTIKVQLTD